MRILLIIGDQPRHYHLVNKICCKFNNVCIIVEKRNSLKYKIKKNYSSLDKVNFNRHFYDRDKLEKKYFSGEDIKFSNKIYKFKNINLEMQKLVSVFNEFKPQILITFGCGIIKEPILSKIPKHSLNFHTGLLPYFKGTAGNFWPFYFLKPNYVGITIHKIVRKLDSAPIMHQTIPKLDPSDGIHDVACKAICKGVDDLVRILLNISNGKKPIFVRQRSIGKLFSDKDFSPQHLRLNYNLFKNKVVKYFLNNQLQKDLPQTIRIKYEKN